MKQFKELLDSIISTKKLFKLQVYSNNDTKNIQSNPGQLLSYYILYVLITQNGLWLSPQ